ncbi:hypothetical protein PRUPE_1G078800 [Prunus persica]|uniref:Uncharacterized protein n=1 Tax=Prunus persica TaxID=3760 RepID=A0A251QTZ1_PRUPE|nr:hypothetical protein PRUPE_1G078800 [Prunus persica]
MLEGRGQTFEEVKILVTRQKRKEKGKPLHIAPQLNNACSRPMVRSISEIMALLHHPKENTPPRRDPVEPLPPMIESSLYLIVLDYEDQEYFNL